MTITELIENAEHEQEPYAIDLRRFAINVLRTIEPTREQCVGIGEHEALSKNFWRALEELEGKP
jgi:hypothetical protein